MVDEPERADPDPGEDQAPPRRRHVTWIIAVLALGAAVPVYVLPMWRDLAGVGSAHDSIKNKLSDMNGLRHMAAACVIAGTHGGSVPLAPDGRLDVYGMLGELDGLPDEIVKFCFSARAGRGPSREEIAAGDYANFPYQRRRGAPDPTRPDGALVVWEREPRDGERLVAMADGSYQVWEEERIQRFFRENPGQE